jgi:hypothetical protein
VSNDIEKVSEGENTRLWYKEIDALYKNTSTGKEYTRYNKDFQKWFDK